MSGLANAPRTFVMESMSEDQLPSSPLTVDILSSSPLSSFHNGSDADDVPAVAANNEAGHPQSLLDFAKQIVENTPANAADNQTTQPQPKQKKSRRKKKKSKPTDICDNMTESERQSFTTYQDICVRFDKSNMTGELKKYVRRILCLLWLTCV